MKYKIVNSIVFVIMLFLTACDTPKQDTWWLGGTLHNCTNAEWKASTKANQLATCADWIASLAKGDGLTPEQFKATFSPEQYKKMSENMLSQVDATVKTGVSADTMKGEAASYATLYWFALKAKTK